MEATSLSLGALTPRRYSFLAALLLLGVAYALRFPMLHRPWERDELDNLGCHIAGAHYAETVHTARLKGAARDWQGLVIPAWHDTAFENGIGNNSAPYSLMAWATLSIFGVEKGHYRAWAVRLPAFLAGFAVLVLLGNFVHRAAGAWAGMLAALWLFLHPGYTALCISARGYTFAVLLLVSITALSQKWRSELTPGHGLLLGALAGLLLGTFLGSGYFLVLFWLWLGWQAWRERGRRGCWDLGVGAFCGAAPILFLAYPALSQAVAISRSGFEFHGLPQGWIPRCLGWIFAGIRLPENIYDPLLADSEFAFLRDVFGPNPLLAAAGLVLLPGLCALGVFYPRKADPNCSLRVLAC